MPNILGIDLGTTNTSASLIPNAGRPVALALGGRIHRDVMRSAALKLSPTKWLAGEEAWQHAEMHPETADRLLTAFKPLLMLPERGETRWKQASHSGEVRYYLEAESLPSSLCPPGFSPADIRRATQEMLSAVGRKLHESYPYTTVDRLVIGTPVGFPDAAREKLLQAAVDSKLVSERAGVALFPEPLAVALTYGIEHQTPRRVLVFDHGGGTLDLTILDVEGKPNYLRYRPLAQTSHDRAGRYYDRLLLSRVFEEAGERGRDALALLRLQNPMQITHPWLLDEAQKVKEMLFREGSRGLARYAYPIDQKPFSLEVSTAMLDDALSPELQVIRTKLQGLIATAEAAEGGRQGRTPAGVQQVLLAGGSSLLPAIRRLIEELFPGVPISFEYAGSRTSTLGFARAVQYRNMIDELTESEWCLFDPAESRPVTVLSLGTRLSETEPAHQRCREDGYYFRAPQGRATLLLFERRDEQNLLVLQADAAGLDPAAVYQAVVTVNRETGRPAIQVFETRTGAEAGLNMRLPGDPGLVAVLQPGEIIRYNQNRYPNYSASDTGCVERIDLISVSGPETKGNCLAMAVGQLDRYRLYLNHPSGVVQRAQVKTEHVFTYQLPRLRPGESVELTLLSEDKFVRIGSSAFYPPERTDRPADCRRAEPKPNPDPVDDRGGPADALPEEGADQAPKGGSSGADGASRSIAGRLKRLLDNKKQ